MAGISLCVVCEDVEVQRAIVAAMPRSLTVRFLTLSANLEGVREGDRRAVLFDHGLWTRAIDEAIIRNAKRGVPAPVVFVRDQSGAVIDSADAWTARIAGRAELRRRGWSAMRAEVVRCLRAAARAAAARASRESRVLLEIIDVLFGDDPPLSVCALSDRIGFTRDDLCTAWDAAFGSDAHLGLAEFIRVVLLLSAVERRHARMGWRRLWKKHLGGRPERGKRIAQRVFGATLDELAGERFPELVALVETVVLRQLGISWSDLWCATEEAGR